MKKLPKLPKYKYLITYRLSEIIFDLIDAFVLRYLGNLGNLSYLGLKEQILKCARSIKQNIIEGVSEVASLKSQIKLLGVAYASVEELVADLEDFTRRRTLKIYPKNHPKIEKFRALGRNLSSLSNLSYLGTLKEKPLLPTSAEEATNLLLTFCHQLSFLLKRQINTLEQKFIQSGGYSENLFKKRLKHRSHKSSKLLRSFTLMELLFVITMISILLLAVSIFLNPLKQIQKAHDAKRKSELATLKKVFEDFYNDKNRFPRSSEVCYDSPTSQRTDNYGLTACYCHICGSKTSSPDFSPYLKNLPCDPKSPKKDFLYDFDCSSNNPQWFRLYTNLDQTDEANNDQATIDVACYYEGCGPALYGYDYGVATNTDLERSQSFSYCTVAGCNACGDYESCNNLDPSQYCQGKKIIIPATSCGAENCPCQP